MLAAVADVGGIFSIAFVAQRPEQFALDELREADDRVQWRPQLMAHVRQELRLRMAGGFRGLLGGTQPLAAPFPYGHVEPHDESDALVRPVPEEPQDPNPRS